MVPKAFLRSISGLFDRKLRTSLEVAAASYNFLPREVQVSREDREVTEGVLRALGSKDVA